MNRKVDVSVCFYGKPFHTILAIKSLLKYSKQHINKIYITIEKKQPQNDLNGIFLVKQMLKHEPVVYFEPKYFYNLGKLDEGKVRLDEDYRYHIPYQYVLEKSNCDLVMVMHNDCLFHDDMVGKMLEIFEENAGKLAGIGPIGQCWNCPAGFEKKCNSKTFDEYHPTKQELIELMGRHNIPRPEITMKLINENRLHPLPECRLNEYASLINTSIYRNTTLPKWNNVTYAGAWDGCDWGTVWFYQMVNQGYKFKHLTLEDYATHAPFNEIGNGISAYGKAEIYWNSENLAKNYLMENYYQDVSPNVKTRLFSSINTFKFNTKKAINKIRRIVKV
jgi:hypothetical protein